MTTGAWRHDPCTEWLDMMVKVRQHADGQAVSVIEPAAVTLCSL